MIDFTNCEYIKMKKIDYKKVMKDIEPLLTDSEEVVGAYKAIRDYCVFTDKRVISVNTQGVTGKSKDFTSLPYSKVTAFSVETSAVFDLDSELELHFSGLGKVRFEFTGDSDILEIGRIVAAHVL